jgi:hypothetical protein
MSATEVIIMCPREWECNEVEPNFVEQLIGLGVKFRPVYGSFRTAYYDDMHAKAGLPAGDAYFWGTYWFTYTEIATRELPERYKYQTEFKYPFISLNNRSHLHRCMFIDSLAKYALIGKGVVTWIKHLNENSDYPYQYYDNNQLLLDDNFVNTLDSMTLPKEYHESLFDIVTESTIDKLFMTEKICFPLVLRKPFLVYGAPSIHQKLIDLGFKMFDEVIDYSFDSIADPAERLEALMQNIKRITAFDPVEIYETLKFKLHYNYIRMMEIAHDSSFIPKGVSDFVEIMDTPDAKMYRDFLSRKPQQAFSVDIWTNKSTAENEQYIHRNHSLINEVIIDTANEYSYHCFDSLIEVANRYRIPTLLLTSTYKYNPQFDNKQTYQNTLIVDWPAHWIAKMAIGMLDHSVYEINRSNGLDINKPNLDCNIEQLYISMNNLATPHRCEMMDILAKYDLVKLGAISWRDVLRHFDSSRVSIESESTLGKFKWKYWTPCKMTLDIPMDMTSRVNQYRIPPQYATAFMQIVPESSAEVFFMTEKTAVPLLLCKPFLVAGCKNFHTNLQDMGFVLYDELFDYSFDSEENLITRYEGIAENIKQYRNVSITELKEIQNSVRDKLLYNRTHALKLSNSPPKATKYASPNKLLIQCINEFEIFKTGIE